MGIHPVLRRLLDVNERNINSHPVAVAAVVAAVSHLLL